MSFIIDLLNLGFKVTVTTIVGVGLFTFLTKPTNDSFGEYGASQAPTGTQTISKYTINSMSKIDDYVFFKLAMMHHHYYLGVAHHWIALN